MTFGSFFKKHNAGSLIFVIAGASWARTIALTATLVLVQACSTRGVQMVDNEHNAQALSSGSKLLPAGDVTYRVAPFDTLQVAVYPRLGRDLLIDYGSQVRIEAAYAGKLYSISPGDALSIEINAETDVTTNEVVRPDGFITVPHLSKDIKAAGRHSTDLAAEIMKALAPMMKLPRVTVSVVSSTGDLLGKISGTYQTGSDGAIVLPTLGSFRAVGKTAAALSKMISAAAQSRFHDPVHVSASIGQLTGRETDPRVDPDGRTYFRGVAKVSPDGNVFVQPGGLVKVAGMSVPEVRGAIKSLVQPFYANQVQVDVGLAETSDLTVFVGGEVRQPGRYAYAKSMTLLQLISLSGWITDNGDLGRVLLLHPSAPGRYVVYSSNLKEVIDHGAVDQDLAVGPRDIVVIPMTTIGRIDQFVDQYIRRIAPFNTTVGYSYITNPTGNTVGNAGATTPVVK